MYSHCEGIENNRAILYPICFNLKFNKLVFLLFRVSNQYRNAQKTQFNEIRECCGSKKDKKLKQISKHSEKIRQLIFMHKRASDARDEEVCTHIEPRIEKAFKKAQNCGRAYRNIYQWEQEMNTKTFVL